MTSLIHWLYPGDEATCLVVNLVVQIAAAVLVAALVSGTLLRRWPAAQHAVWLACLGFTLVCPLTALASKRSGMFSFSLAPATESAAVNSRPADRGEPSATADVAPKTVHEPVIGPADAEPRELPDRTRLRDAAVEPRAEPAVAPPVLATEPKPETAPRSAAQAKPFDFRAIVAAAVGIWAAGVLFLSARLLHGILAVRTLRRMSAPLDQPALADVLAEVRRLLGLARLPPIGLSERIATPVVAGLFRPAVLLPASLPAAIGQGRMRDILLHECAHVARRDPWVVVLQRLVAVVYWPHPLIHFLNRQLARCREEVCDNWVLRAVRPADYADTLLEVAIHCRDRFGVDMPIGLFDVHGKVEDRVRRLLDQRRDGGVRLPARARLGVLAAAATFLAVATSFPLVAPARAEKQPAVEQASSNPDKPKAVGASENQAGALTGSDRKPAAAPEKRAPEQDSRELVEARQRAVAFLVKQQDDGKIGEFAGQEGGTLALVTLALLQSDVKPNDPRLSKLLAKVRELKPGLTYVTSLQTLVLCAAEPKRDLDTIRRNVKWLEETQLHSKERPGAWTYGSTVHAVNAGDNSNSQFAMLALHEADLAGAPAGEKTWLLALDHWLAEQREDGSWGYLRGMDGTGTMTCAGAACVSAAARRLKDKAKVEAAQAAVKRAEKWLAEHFTVEGNPLPNKTANVKLWHFSYLCDLESAARLARWSTIGEHDWRREGAGMLLKSQNGVDGSWRGSGFAETDTVIATSLALLFLRPEAPLPNSNAEADKSEPYIEGITVDSAGKPLAGVQVRSGPRAFKKTTVSGSDGALLGDRWRTPALLAESQDHALIGFSDSKTPDMVYADSEPRARKNEVVRIVLKPARTVHVKVATADGKPAAGVTVQALSETLAFPDSQTDRDGQAAIRVPPDAGVPWVIAWKDNLGFDYYENYHDNFRPRRRVPPGPLPANVELRLHTAGHVRVRTIDSADRPVASVAVAVGMLRLSGKLSDVMLFGSSVAGGQSDASGNCDFAWLPTDAIMPISFQVSKPSYFPAFIPGSGLTDQPHSDPAQPQTETIRLVKNAEASGTVRFADGKPAAGIAIRGTFRQPHGYVNVGATTDADGHYRMRIFPRQSMVIAVSDRDWAAASHTDVRLDDGKAHDHLDFVLSRGTRIHGRVTLGRSTLGGIPAGNRVVTLYELGEHPEEDANKSDHLEGYRQLLARIDDKGNYEFRVGPGRFKLSMPYSTADGGRIEVKVAHQPELVYDEIAAWPAKMLVTGRVVRAADGKPVAGAIVCAELVGRRGADPQAFPRKASADAQGRFSIVGISNTEKCGFYVRAPEADLAGVAIVSSIASDVKIELRPAATVVGRVYDAQGKPAAGAQVTASLSYSPNVDAVTDKSGRYRVPCLAVGSQCFISLDRGRTSSLVDVKLDQPGEITARDLVLPADGPAPAPVPGQLHLALPPSPAAAPEARRPRAADRGSKTKTLTGVVAAPDGAPLADVFIAYFPSRDNETRTDKTGRFRVTVPAADEAVIVILPKQYAPLELIAEPQQTDVGVLRLKKGVILSGTVLSADGKPVAGQWLEVKEARERPYFRSRLSGLPLNRYARSDAAGKVSFDPLPPGDYVVGPSEGDLWRHGGDNRATPIQGVYYLLKVKIEAGVAKPFELKAQPTVKLVAQFFTSDGKKTSGRGSVVCTGNTPGDVHEAWLTTGVAREARSEILAPRGMKNAGLEVMPEGDSTYRYRRSADSPLQSRREMDLGTLTGDLTDIRIVRYAPSVVLVKASDRAGKPIASLQVSARYDDDALNHNSPRTVDFEQQKDGRFLSGSLLPDEKFTVTVTADGYLPQPRSLSLAEGTTSQLDLVLSPR